ncbi:MAG: molybdopterin-dependent oxidoreductase [Comamonadaceae bacterium]|nr:molybdopterin-dependent oxidoreductase [Comamonadaceae bacterium]
MKTTTPSTCPYCGVGCGVLIESEAGRITGVRGNPEHPANQGRLCSKGSTLHLTARPALQAQVRLSQPQERSTRGASPHPVGWNQALDGLAQRLARTVRQHGPDAVGLYVSGQLLTEDYYAFNKFAKGLLGTNNIDTNSRLCMSSAVAGYKATLGADAPPACYDDIAHAATLFISGANPAWAHPILFRRIEDAKRANPALKIIVCDPRRTDSAELADLHLALKPGSDVWLYHGMLRCILERGWLDTHFIATRTQGWTALAALVAQATPEAVQQHSGIAPADLLQAARWFAGVHDGSTSRQPTLSLYCQGLNQSAHGTDNNTALINLHLACGQIGKPGAGPLSLTGQPNAMGGREVGALANQLSAHRNLADAQHRTEVAALWGVPSVPAQPGKAAIEMFQAAADGQIKLLWIACTNPAHSLPDQALVRRALQRAEYVVVQDAYATGATVRYADLLLPASTWGEKEGTVTNSERCISRVRAAVPAPDLAWADWRIVTEVARRLQPLLPERAALPSLFPYDGPEAIWNEHRESTRGHDLDITGLTWAQLEAAPHQWPCPEGAPTGRARLYTDQHFATADGRARFALQLPGTVAEPTDARHPFALLTGRLRDQWHGLSRSGLVENLWAHASEPRADMHAADMARLGLQGGGLAYLTSRRGSIIAPVQESSTLAPGQVFLPMHWGDEVLGGASSTGRRLAGVNALTSGACCPQSLQPELKHTAIKVLKAELPWGLWAQAWLPLAQVQRVRQQLEEQMAQFPFASCSLFGRAEQGCGVQLRAAAHHAVDETLIEHIATLLGLQGAGLLAYRDARRGQWRRARLEATGKTQQLQAVLLAGDTSAQAWIAPLLQERLDAQPLRRALLQPGAKPPQPLAPRGATVCACEGVGENAITGLLETCQGDAPTRLKRLQNELRCGTQCGSCVPQLQRMVQASMAGA